MSLNLDNHKVPGSSEVFYIPEFVTEEEEDYLLRKIRESPHQKWKQLANRRLQLLGGELTSKNVLLSQPMPGFLIAYPNIIDRIRNTGAFSDSPHGAPNHVILNEYLPGQGIMPHEDGPAYYPTVMTISLGSHAVFHYYKYKSEESEGNTKGLMDVQPAVSIFLEPRSAVITRGPFYTSHLHGIEDLEEDTISVAEDGASVSVHGFRSPIVNWSVVKTTPTEGGTVKRDTRYSLTCRDVERVANPNAFLKR